MKRKWCFPKWKLLIFVSLLTSVCQGSRVVERRSKKYAIESAAMSLSKEMFRAGLSTSWQIWYFTKRAECVRSHGNAVAAEVYEKIANSLSCEIYGFSGTVLQIGAAYNDFLSAKVELLDKARLSIESRDKAPYQAAVPEFLHRIGAARKQFDAAAESLERVVKENPGLHVDRTYIPNFIENVRQEFDNADEWATFFKLPCDPDYTSSTLYGIRIVMLNRTEVGIAADLFAYSVMYLFDMIPPEALVDFREVAAKQWTMLERFRGEWLSDQKQIEQNAEASLKRLQVVVAELAAIKLGELQDLRLTREGAQKAIGAARERIRKKFAPKEDDDVGMLWGKALRFMSVNMPEDAKLCIDALRRRSVSEFPPMALDTAEAIFLSKKPLPFAGGVLVCAYESPATSHAIFKVGDVITEVNGKPCRRYEDYHGKARNTYTIYRRNAKGDFDKLTETMPENQPRVALVNLTE